MICFLVPVNASSISLISQKKEKSIALSKKDNLFTSDPGGPYDTSNYGTVFDNFPSLSYFPEFGDIFRLSRSTTLPPPFTFPDFLMEVFQDKPSASSSYRDSIGGSRPVPSGTRTKVTKQNQNEEREKPKGVKNKSPNKSRNYQKIFRFTSDRVNLAEFDTKKKMNENYLTLVKGDELDSDKVKRNKFLILHGGVFEIESTGRLSLFPDLDTQQTSHDDTYPY